ncbi:hypothetical protein ACFOON_12305 [Novosphingobium piscinae]|uniref:Uncharacterized protein n=1 Tax=Novosphingobium piscinae TaxID=1507448 RepID=A0A7X1FW14_9SPHN|nr:hypothetical protein [Novosphingobium piscinae]MBC2668001.1 hypothetical protein [Novosphingobium piscinae]
MFDSITILAMAGLIGLGIVALTVLTLWQGWLRLKLTELERHPDRHSDRHRADPDHPLGITRIEMADVKERLRKLEAIAAGVDL